NGIVETLKHALIGEVRLLPFFERYDSNSILKENVLEEMIFLSASFKAAIVGQDVREADKRAILNFGHTVGHAIESWMRYKTVSHGTAVAWGIKAETEISRRIGFLTKIEAEKINELLQKYDLLDTSVSINPEGLLAHMKFDKKNVKDSLRFVLLKKIGEPVYNIEVSEDLVIDVLEKLIAV
ncbi:MAG: 3-dehydroquinate synthase, partial [Spirochaetes bacterium]|nr:3-dehydroquinate synthase [Spirochaetota bacterium]